MASSRLKSGLSDLGETFPIVFDIGSAYTKCGFAGEESPRGIVPSTTTVSGEVGNNNGGRNSQARKVLFAHAQGDFVFLSHLLVS